MRRKFRVLSILSLYLAIIIIYMVFFLLHIESIPLFLFLTIGSVAVLSTSTIYTIIQSKSNHESKIGKKKFITKPKSFKSKKSIGLIEDYIEAMPLIERYIDSDESYEDLKEINDYIFSTFSSEELEKIDLLDLSKMDKIFFLREMLYFNSDERKILIEDMLKNKEKVSEKIIYRSPTNPIKIDDKVRVYVRSLVEPGEKTKIIIIETNQLVNLVKERIGILFDYDLNEFLLSYGGILLDQNTLVMEYNLEDDDEIALIPLRK